MKRFDYIIILISKSQVDLEIMCTDRDTLKMIDTIITSEYSISGKPVIKTPSSGTLLLEYTGLNYRQWEIGLWIIQQLCQQGWEPFDFQSDPSQTYSSLKGMRAFYHLRREGIAVL